MENRIKRALISVFDKDGIEPLCEILTQLNIELVSTGGTAQHLKKNHIPVTMVEDLTGFPEMLDGRVKTLHPLIHAAILADLRLESHRQQLDKMNITPVGLVVVNLYPFLKTIRNESCDFETAVEMIDIGGPAMIRAAAKNHANLAVVTCPADYSKISSTLIETGGSIPEEMRLELAARAFTHTAEYDSYIAEYLNSRSHLTRSGTSGSLLPERIDLSLTYNSSLRYGENPHQQAAVYHHRFTPPVSGILSCDKLGGKEISFNNYLDLKAAWDLVSRFDTPCSAIIKHQNPCGAAIGDDLALTYENALACDPLSAYGGIVALNRQVDIRTARLLHETDFLEVIGAPGFTDESLALLLKKKNRRILRFSSTQSSSRFDIRLFEGGALVQETDAVAEQADVFKIVTKRQPGPEEWQDLLFAWRVCASVKSNAIVLAKSGITTGIGAGQVSRVDSTEIAVRKAADKTKGSVMASDAFFPFKDSIEAVRDAGVVAVIQPGGSIRDPEVIEACDECGISMVFTGFRHFKH